MTTPPHLGTENPEYREKGAENGGGGGKKPWVWVGGPVAPGASATTLGRLILVRRDAAGDEHLMRHERVHVRQWSELGLVGFLRRYLGAYFRWRLYGYGHWAAYRRIPLEVEAEWEARRTATLVRSGLRPALTPAGTPEGPHPPALFN